MEPTQAAGIGRVERIEDQRNVPAQMTQLHDAVDQLGQAVTELEHRLTPVLADRPDSPGDRLAEVRPGGQSEIANSMYEGRSAIEGIRGRVVALLDRLEV